MRIQPLLARLGVVLIAVGNGDQKWAKIYADTVPFVGEVVVDAKSQTHKTLGTKRWGLSVINSFARSNVSSIYKKYGSGYKNYNHTGGSNENGLQTGAVLVTEPGDDGEVIYTYREGKHAPTDFADEHAILRALGWEGELPELPEVERNADGTADATAPVVVLSPKARKLLGLPPLDEEDAKEETSEAAASDVAVSAAAAAGMEAAAADALEAAAAAEASAPDVAASAEAAAAETEENKTEENKE